MPVVGFAPGWAGRYVVGVDVYGAVADGTMTAAMMQVSSVREFALEAKRRQEKDIQVGYVGIRAVRGIDIYGVTGAVTPRIVMAARSPGRSGRGP